VVTVSQPTRRENQRTEEELCAIYDQRYVDQYDPHAVQRIGRLLPLFDLTGHERVVDFGCGNGTLLELISDRVAEYVGVDFSDAFVRESRRRQAARGIRHATYHCGDIVKFCAAHRERFDVAFAIDFIEHIYDDQLRRIGPAIRDVLKPDGVFYLHTPNGEYFMERLRDWGVLRQIEGHVGVRNAFQYERLIAESGFSDVSVRYLPHYLRVARALNALGALPLVGQHFRARLFLTCRK
jgi:2-polyprenyl-6-hydroxyphenyl methylase / 3-demethylubiquinone-9 3-methyltransferase